MRYILLIYDLSIFLRKIMAGNQSGIRRQVYRQQIRQAPHVIELAALQFADYIESVDHLPAAGGCSLPGIRPQAFIKSDARWHPSPYKFLSHWLHCKIQPLAKGTHFGPH